MEFNTMHFYGYGYRKNCFGERMFYEDDCITYNWECAKKWITAGLKKMESRNDECFSFKVCYEDSGECVAVSAYNCDNDTFTVTYSRSWNSNELPQNISKKAVIKKLLAIALFESDI